MSFIGLYSDDFDQVFSKLLDKANVTCYKIGQFTHLDQPYLSRLKKGERKNPSPQTILKISFALTHYSDKIKLHDVEELFESAGYSSPFK